MGVAYDAMIFAFEAHRNQKRKYTGNPYTDHLAEVAGITASVILDEHVIAIAWLHDVIEDIDIGENDLSIEFGPMVSSGVAWLSDLEKGNRKERKELSRIRLSNSPPYIQTIKCADLISNTSSIVEHDHDFAKV